MPDHLSHPEAVGAAADVERDRPGTNWTRRSAGTEAIREPLSEDDSSS